MKKIILYFGIFIIIPQFNYCIAAQDTKNDERISYGIWGSINSNTHNTDFKSLSECPSCSPGYNDGQGIGYGLGATIDVPYSSNWYLSGKVFFKTLNAELIRKEPIYVVQPSVLPNGSIDYTRVLGEFEHSMDTKFSIIGIEPAVKYNIYKDFFLSVGLPSSLIISSEYSQIEKITKPNSGTFMDDIGNDTYSRERNKSTGEIKSANSIYFGADFSLSYQLQLSANDEWALEPNISYTLGLTNLVTEKAVNHWYANSLGLGVALKYSPKEKAAPKNEYKRIDKIDTIRVIVDNIDTDTICKGITASHTTLSESDIIRMNIETISRTDTLKIAKHYVLKGDIEIVGIDSLNNETPNPKIRIEEFVYNRFEPLLNYIFFDNNSYQLPGRYKQFAVNQTRTFTFDSLLKASSIEMYYHILNIVGQRLTEIPSADLTIVGCNSDFGVEKGNIELSTARANTVRDYFVDIWGINPQRLKLEYRNLSSKASVPKTDPDKIQENQRVELYSKDESILKHVLINDTNRVATFPVLRLKPTINADAGLAQWKVSAFQNTDSIGTRFDFAGTGNNIENADWNIKDSERNIPKFAEPIEYTLYAKDKRNKEITIRKQTPAVEIISVQAKRVEKSEDYEIERMSLILFDFDKASISKNHRKFIDNINTRIQDSSIVEIIGYTDRTGDKEYNISLAQRRASTIQKQLKACTYDIKAGNEYIFDNESPEGRFYCRTVIVLIKTKIGK